MLEPIGNGRCGAVRKGRMDREWVAVKSISKEGQSTHLVQWRGAFAAEDSHVVHVVMEFVEWAACKIRWHVALGVSGEVFRKLLRADKKR